METTTIRVQFRISAEVARLRIAGDLDLAAEAGLEAAAISALECDRVQLDLTRVDFADSVGIAWVLGLHRRLEARHGTLSIEGLSPNVLRLLLMLGVTELLGVHQTP